MLAKLVGVGTLAKTGEHTNGLQHQHHIHYEPSFHDKHTFVILIPPFLVVFVLAFRSIKSMSRFRPPSAFAAALLWARPYTLKLADCRFPRGELLTLACFPSRPRMIAACVLDEDSLLPARPAAPRIDVWPEVLSARLGFGESNRPRPALAFAASASMAKSPSRSTRGEDVRPRF